MRLGYRTARFLCQWAGALYFRTRVFGIHHVPREGGVLLVCNHQSFMDPVLVGLAVDREAHFMARDSLFTNRYFGRLIWYLNAFPVKRATADIGAIKESLRRLKQGKVIVLFPEGTRSPDGRIQPMLPGLGGIAKKAAVPLVPTLIDGMTQLWPRHRAWPSMGEVIVEYGHPIQPAEYESLNVDQLMELVHRRLTDMQARWHGRVPRRRLKWWRHASVPESSAPLS